MNKQGQKEFPWTSDQFQRYTVLREFLKEFYSSWGAKGDGQRERSEKARGMVRVLDVGGLSPRRGGKSFWLPLEEIWDGFGVVADVAFYPFQGKNFVQADGCRLPFPDKSFDVVSALDVLEHAEEEKREALVEELCRVAADSVLISIPLRSAEMEAAERALLDETRRILGVEHRQLYEHLHYGLPERKRVSLWLQERMGSGFELSFGSLTNWLFLQTFRLPFFRRGRQEIILELLDRWALAINPKAEFLPPFSRHFWIYSREIPKERLEAGMQAVLARLREPGVELQFEDVLLLNRKIVDFWNADGVSVLVVSEGKERLLRECLHHLLSQQADFDLEICVWVLRGKISPSFRQEFAGVKFIEEKRNGLRMNDLRRRVMELKEKHVLLLDERILLPSQAVASLWRRWKGQRPGEEGHAEKDWPGREKKQETVLCPRIIQGKRAYGVWCGGRFSPRKFLAGRIANVFWNFSAGDCCWIFGECLFFRKEALFSLREKSGKIAKRYLFLWEAEESGLQFVYCPEIIVHRQGGD